MLNKRKALIVLIAVLGVVVLMGNFAVLAEEVDSLLVHCGAGLRKPMEEIGITFEEKFGVKIEYNYGGSAHLLSQMELIDEGDVYVPGALYYYESAKEKGLIDMEKDVALHIPVIAVPEGNPANIHSLEDMGKEGVKIVLGDEKAAAIGRLSQQILSKNNLSENVNANVVAKAATVNELVVYLSMRQSEASIIWEDNVYGIDEVKIIHIDKDKNIIKTIPACVLSFSEKKEMAAKFVEYVASEEGKNTFQKYGFKPIN